MSFLSELKKQKQRLVVTETIVTNSDGQRFIEKLNEDNSFERTLCAPSAYGFVVDTKPDDIPVLIMNYVYIGSQDCAVDSVLNKYNIEQVLSVGINANVHVKHKHVHCLDLPETDIKPVLFECFSFINEAINSEKNILIHCNAGVSRTAMVAIAYLMYCKKMNFVDAYNVVKTKRPAIQPNAGFVKQLKLLNIEEIIV